MKLAIVALAAAAKTTRAASVNTAVAADCLRAIARSTAGRNPGPGVARNLARLMVVLGVCGLTYGAAGEALAAGAEQFRYHFVPLDPTVPPGLGAFNPATITENGAIYGTAITCGPASCKGTAAVYRNGVTTGLHEGSILTANERGTALGVAGGIGWVLFNGSTVTQIPTLPDAIFSEADSMNDNDTVHLYYLDNSFNYHDYLYRKGVVTPLNIPSDSISGVVFVNNSDTVAGRIGTDVGDRAFRFHPPTGQMELLAPVGQDQLAWAAALNDAGDVLGWSFSFDFHDGTPGVDERVGFWQGSQFHTQFLEDTPEFPTVSNRLCWNKSRLIVITDTDDLNSYLVPRAGVRLNLADLTDTLPPWTVITGVNNRGDLIGVGGPARGQVDESFLLQRVGLGSALPVKRPARHHTTANPALAAARLAALQTTTRDSTVRKERPVRK